MILIFKACRFLSMQVKTPGRVKQAVYALPFLTTIKFPVHNLFVYFLFNSILYTCRPRSLCHVICSKFFVPQLLPKLSPLPKHAEISLQAALAASVQLARHSTPLPKHLPSLADHFTSAMHPDRTPQRLCPD